MSVLLIGPEGDAGEAIASLLLEEGDEVRVLISRNEDASAWKARGAHVAVGDLNDDDLIERAAQRCRSVVTSSTANLDAVTSGAKAAAVERLIILSSSSKAAIEAERRIGGTQHVILVTRKRGLLSRPIPPKDVASAVSAADDLGGEPRLIADLGVPEGWSALRLEPR